MGVFGVENQHHVGILSLSAKISRRNWRSNTCREIEGARRRRSLTSTIAANRSCSGFRRAYSRIDAPGCRADHYYPHGRRGLFSFIGRRGITAWPRSAVLKSFSLSCSRSIPTFSFAFSPMILPAFARLHQQCGHYSALGTSVLCQQSLRIFSLCFRLASSSYSVLTRFASSCVSWCVLQDHLRSASTLLHDITYRIDQEMSQQKKKENNKVDNGPKQVPYLFESHPLTPAFPVICLHSLFCFISGRR